MQHQINSADSGYYVPNIKFGKRRTTTMPKGRKLTVGCVSNPK